MFPRTGGPKTPERWPYFPGEVALKLRAGGLLGAEYADYHLPPGLLVGHPCAGDMHHTSGGLLHPPSSVGCKRLCCTETFARMTKVMYVCNRNEKDSITLVKYNKQVGNLGNSPTLPTCLRLREICFYSITDVASLDMFPWTPLLHSIYLFPPDMFPCTPS